MDMPAVQRFIKAMQEIEAWENQHHDDEDDGGEKTGEPN
jgi:hypothetical protein